MNKYLLLSLALSSATALSAQSPLTTLPNFQSNNGGSPGGAIYFDLASTTNVAISALEFNFGAAAGTAVGCEIYVRGGTHVGFENTTAGWNLIASDDGTAIAVGQDMPTPVTLNAPVCIPPGSTVGIAIVAVGTAHRYTNGNGTNEITMNADLTLTAGTATNVPFTGQVFNPRVPNLTFSYLLGPCVLTVPPRLEGAVDTTAGMGMLSSADETFVGGDSLRVQTVDPSGAFTGQPEFIFLNTGSPGSNPVAMTSFIPNFVQRWSGSTPSDIDLVLANISGSPRSIATPVGFGSPGGSIRFQTLVFDGMSTNPVIPVLATPNTKTFVIALDPSVCSSSEGFEAGFPANWQTTTGTTAWTVNSGGTTSGSTGPNSAIEGLNYLYCETSGATNTTFGAETDLVTTSSIAFQLSRVGATIGTLTLNLVDASGTVLPGGPIATFTGSGPEWQQQVVAYTNPGVPHRVQFTYVSGTSFTGDLAIDDICHFN